MLGRWAICLLCGAVVTTASACAGAFYSVMSNMGSPWAVSDPATLFLLGVGLLSSARLVRKKWLDFEA
jgi:hypothetical protein